MIARRLWQLGILAVSALMVVPLSTGVGAADPAHPTTNWALDLMGEGGVTATGEGVNVYIIDDGMNVTLPEFGGRASIVYDAYNAAGSPNYGQYTYPLDSSCPGPYVVNGSCVDGHATQMASAAAGAQWGIAKKANILDVKVQNCADCSSLDAQKFIDGINWVRTDAAARKVPAVAVISTNFPFLSQVNSTLENNLVKAVNNLALANVFVAVSAGNVTDSGGFNYQACVNAPADASYAMTVGASDNADNEVWEEPIIPGQAATWSSAYGTCVDISAPGEQVTLTMATGTAEAHNGTSFSTPYVAGAAALYKSKFGDASTDTIKNWLVQHSASLHSVQSSWIYGQTPWARLNLAGL